MPLKTAELYADIRADMGIKRKKLIENSREGRNIRKFQPSPPRSPFAFSYNRAQKFALELE